MNRVKFYKAGECVVVRVTQRQREINREIRCKISISNPSGWKALPPRFPTVAMAERAMSVKGYTRAKP